jgi:2-C-methyl-D-erythritol 4-phosphate cytidylyltransferase/2-C-methyl-D-erythritol 2,4-cyclodiphosphate synthase
MKSSAILLMAGSGTRSLLPINKTLYKINDIPLFMYSLNKLYEVSFDEYILVTNELDYDQVKTYLETTPYDVKIILGGATRCESVREALKHVTTDVALIHDAARPLVSTCDIKTMKESFNNYKLGTMYHNVTDTVRLVEDKISLVNREKLYAVTTPQYFSNDLFDEILTNDLLITDEISLFENKYEINFIKETSNNLKLTNANDVDYIEYQLSNKYKYHIGTSLDYHPFSNHDKLILGGVIFDDYPILDGHSDADVVYHVVAESLLGASNLGDLGTLFPDNDPKYKGIASSILLEYVVDLLNQRNILIENIDVMVYLIKPSLKNYKKQMASNIKNITKAFNVCVKAATLNKRGLISLEEGIGAEAISLIKIPHNK